MDKSKIETHDLGVAQTVIMKYRWQWCGADEQYRLVVVVCNVGWGLIRLHYRASYATPSQCMLYNI